MEFTIVETRASRDTMAAGRRETPAPADGTALDTSAGTAVAVEHLLAEVASAVMGGAEQAAAALSFQLRGALVSVRGKYDDLAEPALAVDYDLAIATDEPERRFVQFHERVRGSERVRRLGAAGVHLTGRLRRAAVS
jgi:hypothetical protein